MEKIYIIFNGQRVTKINFIYVTLFCKPAITTDNLIFFSINITKFWKCQSICREDKPMSSKEKEAISPRKNPQNWPWGRGLSKICLATPSSVRTLTSWSIHHLANTLPPYVEDGVWLLWNKRWVLKICIQFFSSLLKLNKCLERVNLFKNH